MKSYLKSSMLSATALLFLSLFVAAVPAHARFQEGVLELSAAVTFQKGLTPLMCQGVKAGSAAQFKCEAFASAGADLEAKKICEGIFWSHQGTYSCGAVSTPGPEARSLCDGLFWGLQALRSCDNLLPANPGRATDAEFLAKDLCDAVNSAVQGFDCRQFTARPRSWKLCEALKSWGSRTGQCGL